MPDSDQKSPIINMEELKEIMDDDRELIQECFDDFLSDWPQLFAQIQDAVAEKDPDRIDESAHKLKGTLKYLAAEPAARAALAVESAGRNRDLTGLDEKLKHLETQCRHLIEFIQGAAL